MKKKLWNTSPLAVIVLFFTFSLVNASHPASYPETLSPGRSIEEDLAWKAQFTTWAEQNGHIQKLSGEDTKGATINISGKDVKLPADAFVLAYVVSVEPLSNVEETLKHVPYYAIQSGNSVIAIAARTGFVVNLTLDPADSKPFEFLKKHIQGYLPQISAR